MQLTHYPKYEAEMSRHRVSWQDFTVVCDGCSFQQTFATGTEPLVIQELFNGEEDFHVCKSCQPLAHAVVWAAFEKLSKKITELTSELETLKERVSNHD